VINNNNNSHNNDDDQISIVPYGRNFRDAAQSVKNFIALSAVDLHLVRYEQSAFQAQWL